MTASEALSTLVSELLDALGESNTEQAEALGVTATAIYYWRTGRQPPSLAQILAICDRVDPSRREAAAAAWVALQTEKAEAKAAQVMG